MIERCQPTCVQCETVKALNGVELLLPRARRGAPKWFFFLFATSSVIIPFIATKQLCRSAIRTNTPCGVRQVACHVQVALFLSFLGPPWCQWCSDWCALGNSATMAIGCVCLSHVSGWLRLVEVFAAVPLGVACFLSCLVVGYLVARWNVGAQAGCFITAFGYRRPPRHESASLVFWGSGASGTGANTVDKKSTFWGCFPNKRALLTQRWTCWSVRHCARNLHSLRVLSFIA